MTIRENVLDVHAESVMFKEHLAKCPKHGTRELGLQMAAYFQSGQAVRFAIDHVAHLLDSLFYSKGETVNGWPTCIDAAIHSVLQGILGQSPKAIPEGLLGGYDRPDSGDRIRTILVACESLTCPKEYEAVVGIDQQDEGDERLRIDFETNPSSQVQEALMTFVIEDDLCGGVEWAGVVQTYHKADGGGIEWDDPSVVISDHDSMTPDDVAFAVRTTPQLRATIPYFNQEVS